MAFLGEVNSLEPVYAMADIFLLSSRLDPFPNVAIDAMLTGLPVVCFSKGSGVAEMLSKSADLKRLVVPYADAASAAQIIEQLSADDCYYQATKTAIRDLALSTFDMDRYVTSLDRLAERAALTKDAAVGTYVPGVTR
jgi:glycosyltransferase involved in cell wall biosynthesis